MLRTQLPSCSARPAKARKLRPTLAIEGLEDRTVLSPVRTLGGLEFVTSGTFAPTTTPTGTQVQTNGPVQVGVAPTDGAAFVPLVEFGAGVSFLDSEPTGRFTGRGEVTGIIGGKSIPLAGAADRDLADLADLGLLAGGTGLGDGKSISVARSEFHLTGIDLSAGTVKFHGDITVPALGRLDAAVQGNDYVVIDSAGAHLTGLDVRGCRRTRGLSAPRRADAGRAAGIRRSPPVARGADRLAVAPDGPDVAMEELGRRLGPEPVTPFAPRATSGRGVDVRTSGLLPTGIAGRGAIVAKVSGRQPAMTLKRLGLHLPLWSKGLIRPGSFQRPDLVLKHLLHPSFGDIHLRRLHADPRGCLCSGLPLLCGQSECLPRLRGDSQPNTSHRLLKQLLVERGLKPAEYYGVARSLTGPLAGLEEVKPRVLGHGLKPRPEAPRRVVREVAELGGEFQEDGLGHVLGVSVLKAPGPAPADESGPVMVDELGPSPRIGGIGPEAAEESGSGA
jgi:hypothetical protein